MDSGLIELQLSSQHFFQVTFSDLFIYFLTIALSILIPTKLKRYIHIGKWSFMFQIYDYVCIKLTDIILVTNIIVL